MQYDARFGNARNMSVATDERATTTTTTATPMIPPPPSLERNGSEATFCSLPLSSSSFDRNNKGNIKYAHLFFLTPGQAATHSTFSTLSFLHSHVSFVSHFYEFHKLLGKHFYPHFIISRPSRSNQADQSALSYIFV